MTARHRARVGLAAVATGALLVVLALSDQHRGEVVATYVLVLATLLLTGVVRHIWDVAPPESRSLFEDNQPVASPQFSALDNLERGVATALTPGGFRTYSGLRPPLRAAASARLSRRGIDLNREPESARSLLGESAWDLLIADRGNPSRGARDVRMSLEKLQQLVAAVERL